MDRGDDVPAAFNAVSADNVYVLQGLDASVAETIGMQGASGAAVQTTVPTGGYVAPRPPTS